MKKVNVIITAWNRVPERFDYFKLLVESMEKYMNWGDLNCKWIVAIESYRHCRKEEMEDYMKEHGIIWYYRPPPPGFGKNLNFLLSLCDASIVFYIQDDHIQLKPLSIQEDYDYLLSTPDVGMIRYDANFARYSASKHVQLFDKSRDYYNISTKAKYYYCDHAQLKKLSYHELTGPYYEGYYKGWDYAQCENRMVRQSVDVSDEMRIILKGHGDYFKSQDIPDAHASLIDKKMPSHWRSER